MRGYFFVPINTESGLYWVSYITLGIWIATSYCIAIFQLGNRISLNYTIEFTKLCFEFCVFSHYPIGIMTKSFPVHITSGWILLVKNSDPDIKNFNCVVWNLWDLHGFHPRKGLRYWVVLIYQLLLLRFWIN